MSQISEKILRCILQLMLPSDCTLGNWTRPLLSQD
uniref:Uncharacterized protein n=1 Tax=Arundo donax TaxID=35708 RepID=A0A0A8ZVC3_ARUDO